MLRRRKAFSDVRVQSNDFDGAAAEPAADARAYLRRYDRRRPRTPWTTPASRNVRRLRSPRLPTLLLQAPRGFRRKSVVHSDNMPVTWRATNGGPAGVASLFHAQVLDSTALFADGTFFTNVELTHVFSLQDSCGNAPCTDLSTDRVDKGKSLCVPRTCMTFVTNDPTVRRKPMVAQQAAVGNDANAR